MVNKARERKGLFIITSRENLNPNGIICAMCDKLLTEYNSETDIHSPSCEELLKEGAVPIPNFGWFCSQACGKAYEKEYKVNFQRDTEGKISYY